MKKQKENSHEAITRSEMGKQNVQAEKVYCKRRRRQSQTQARLMECAYSYHWANPTLNVELYEKNIPCVITIVKLEINAEIRSK